MTAKRMAALTVALPALSVAVSGGIVVHQYARRAALARELRVAEQQLASLARRLPPGAAPAVREHHEHGPD